MWMQKTAAKCWSIRQKNDFKWFMPRSTNQSCVLSVSSKKTAKQLESVAEISNFQCIDTFQSIATLRFDMFQSIEQGPEANDASLG